MAKEEMEEQARNAAYRIANRAASMRQLASDEPEKLKNPDSVIKRLDKLVDLFGKWFGI